MKFASSCKSLFFAMAVLGGGDPARSLPRQDGAIDSYRDSSARGQEGRTHPRLHLSAAPEQHGIIWYPRPLLRLAQAQHTVKTLKASRSSPTVSLLGLADAIALQTQPSFSALDNGCRELEHMSTSLSRLAACCFSACVRKCGAYEPAQTLSGPCSYYKNGLRTATSVRSSPRWWQARDDTLSACGPRAHQPRCSG
jgi:hypothetical protein